MRLAEDPGVRIAIVTGRQLSDIRSRAALPGAAYIGNYGLEIAQLGRRWVHPGAAAAKGPIRAVSRALKAALRGFPGTLFEDKTYSLNVHYRRARSPCAKERLRRRILPFLQAHPGLALRHSRKVWEILPNVRWGKGEAILRLARSMGAGTGIVFVGDDVSDEQGFKALGRRAQTYRVGPGRSVARFRLRDRGAVLGLLRRLTLPRAA